MGPTVLLLTSNGAGLGHLARMTALASALSARDAQPVLGSMSAALPLVTAATGLRGEYLPAQRKGWVDQRHWQRYAGDRIAALTRETEAGVVVFDGVVPYAALLLARARLPDVAFVWSRRGFWKPGAIPQALWATPAFDLIIEPGDLCAAADRGATRGAAALRVAPVSLAAGASVLPRDEARRRLGLLPETPAVLVTLGTALRGDLVGPGEAAVRAVLRHDEWQVAVTRLPLSGAATGGVESARAIEVNGVFPLVPLMSAFDAAVAGAGYNSVHELLPSRVPTLLVAKHRGTDDQVARAEYAEARGWALSARDIDPAAVGAATERLLDARVRERLTNACAALPPVDGAEAAAEAVLALGEGFGGHVDGWRERAVRLEALARTTLGARRRPRLAARAVPDLRMQPSYEELLGDEPVEHVLTDASPSYLSRRRQIAVRAYRRALL